MVYQHVFVGPDSDDFVGIRFCDASSALMVEYVLFDVSVRYMLVAFFIAYFFVVYSLQSAYKSSLSLHSRNAGSTRRAPKWMTKCWLFLTVAIEVIVLMVCSDLLHCG